MATIVAPIIKSEANNQEDLFRHCRQRISKSGRIAVSRKAWVFRSAFLIIMTAFMIYNVWLAVSAGDALVIYAMLMQVHALITLFYGWYIYRNRATGKIPDNLVSVIIPVYNQEKLIEKVIDAIFASTYTNLEVVAVNDGSKDGTGAILDAIAARNPNLKVIHQANGGKRTAVAAGFYASRGAYIVLIDSDSIVDRYAIAEFMKAFAANPSVGGMVGNGKVLNSEENILTRCQDVWYDNTFNINKSAESCFGNVLCLSGCLAAYRREAIARFIPFWVKDQTQYSDDRSLTTYAIATNWAKNQFAPLERRLMKSMAEYDDAEDRALTTQAFKQWETAYQPTAMVYTEVPDHFRTYMRQQIRWRKGYLRSSFFASAFFWRKNPIMAFLFYMEFMYAFVAPLVAFSILIYRPIVLHSYWFLFVFLGGQILLGLAVGLDYKFRDPAAKNWKYKPLMNMISAIILPWIIIPALWGFRKKGWLTR
jgi:hyaluronan synthase